MQHGIEITYLFQCYIIDVVILSNGSIRYNNLPGFINTLNILYETKERERDFSVVSNG